MFQTNNAKGLAALATTLPELVFARGGASFNPHDDVWVWSDGPFRARLDFRRYINGFEAFVPSLKQCLVPFVKGHSTSHVVNLNGAFSHFVNAMGVCPAGPIAVQHISNYAAKLSVHDVGRLGTLNALLQKWVYLGLPGVEPDCATYLQDRRKPGNRKGDAVRTRDPVHGPLSEAEYTALHTAVNDAYGRGALPLWTLLLTRLLFACGGRISQYAALKIKDFDSATFELNLPQAKTGEEHARSRFVQFDIGRQTSHLIVGYLKTLREDGLDYESAFFPHRVVMPKGPSNERRAAGDMFYGHCMGNALAHQFKILVAAISPPTARLDFASIPISTKRFRYTFGTRLAEEGASKAVIANRLGHADLQNVGVYVEASPKVIANIDSAIGALLAPLARAFRGRLVEDEAQTAQKGAPGSRIIDFRVSKDPVGSCEGKGSGCAFNKPVACYTCFRFEPWLDAPHEKVLHRLLADREKWPADDRLSAVNDESIRAVQEVISLCAQVRMERGIRESEGDE